MTPSDKLREIAHKYGGAIITGYGQSSASGSTEMFTAEEQCLSDLTALISEEYYPKVFIRWIFWNEYYMTEEGLFSPVDDMPKGMLDELFNYWKENVR